MRSPDLRAERRRAARAQARGAVDAYNDAVHRIAVRGAPEDLADRWVAMENLKRVGRRDFLKGAGLAAVALAAAAAQPRLIRAATSKQPSVAIVGGGLRGLRAAHVLWTKYGWTSTVYEAGDRGSAGAVRPSEATGPTAWSPRCTGEFISSTPFSMLNLVKRVQPRTGRYPRLRGRHRGHVLGQRHRYTQAQLNADWQAWAVGPSSTMPCGRCPGRSGTTAYSVTGAEWDHIERARLDGLVSCRAERPTTSVACAYEGQIDEYGGDPAGPVRAQPDDDPRLLRQRQRAWLPAHGLPVPGRHGRALARHRGQRPDRHGDGQPAGSRHKIKLEHVLVALKANANGTYALTFDSGGSTKQVTVDSVVLAVPFVTLRNVGTLPGRPLES